MEGARKVERGVTVEDQLVTPRPLHAGRQMPKPYGDSSLIRNARPPRTSIGP